MYVITTAHTDGREKMDEGEDVDIKLRLSEFISFCCHKVLFSLVECGSNERSGQRRY